MTSWLEKMVRVIHSETQAVRFLIYGYLGLTLLCAFLLALPFSQSVNQPFIDHLFMAVSLVSTTGLACVDLNSTYNTFGELVALLMIQMGGIGYMAIISFLLAGKSKRVPVLSMRLLRVEFGLPRKYPLVAFINSVIFFTLFIEAIGTYFLYQGFVQQCIERPLFNAVFHSVSAFCTAGFSLFSDSFYQFSDSPLITWTIIALSLLGSIGFIIIVDVYQWVTRQKRRFSLSSKIILTSTAVILILGTVFLYFSDSQFYGQNGLKGVELAFFQTMAAHTTVGFSVMDMTGFGAEALFIFMVLMLIGASPAGTGGGIKTTTIAVLFGVMKSVLLKRRNATFFRATIPQERMLMAMASFTFFMIVLFLLMWILFHTDGHHLPFEALLFEGISALGTAGLSTGVTSELTILGKLVICLMMFVGRIGVITFGLSLRKQSFVEGRPGNEEDLAL